MPGMGRTRGEQMLWGGRFMGMEGEMSPEGEEKRDGKEWGRMELN